MDQRSLSLYEGRWLTDAEISLLGFFENKFETELKEAEDKIIQKKFLTQSSRLFQMGDLKPETSKPTDPQPTLEITTSIKSSATSTGSIPDQPLLSGEESDVESEDQAISFPSPIKHPRRTSLDDALIDSYTATDSTELPHLESSTGGPLKTIKKRKQADLEEEEATTADQYEPFSREFLVSEEIWRSLNNTAPCRHLLPGFGLGLFQRQTLAVRVTVPGTSASWTLNLAPEKDLFLSQILLHFNPRLGKGTLMLNDKQGTWGDQQKRNLVMSGKPEALCGRQLDVVIQVREQGFFVFVNNSFSDFFLHRTEVEPLETLQLVISSHDDNGNPQNVVVHKVWWGYCDPQRFPLPPSAQRLLGQALNALKAAIKAEENPNAHEGDLVEDETEQETQTQDALLPSHDLLIPKRCRLRVRTVLVQGLPGLSDLVKQQGIEYMLFDVFANFNVEAVSLVTGQPLGFVRLESAELVTEAVAQLDGVALVDEDKEFILTLTPMSTML